MNYKYLFYVLTITQVIECVSGHYMSCQDLMSQGVSTKVTYNKLTARYLKTRHS